MKALCKKCIIGTLIVLMTLGVVALQPPQKASAASPPPWTYDPVAFYTDFGSRNKIAYLDSEFYFGGKSKLAQDSKNTWLYRTVGYKVTITTKSYTVSVSIPVTGGIVKTVNQYPSGGYHYQLNKFTLRNLIKEINKVNSDAGTEFSTYGGTIIVDNWMTVIACDSKGRQTPWGSMDANGVPHDVVYDTWDGITHALDGIGHHWSDYGKSLESYYGNKVEYKSDLTSGQTVYARFQLENGGYSGYYEKINDNFLIGATVYWRQPPDDCYKETIVSYVADGQRKVYVDVPRNSYTQRSYVAYQDENGNYSNWLLMDTKTPFYGANYKWSFAGDTLNNPISVNYTVTGAKDNYIKIPRKQFELTLNKDDGIATVTGGGKYYVGQTVNINATLKPEGVKWKGWEGNEFPFSQSYSFVMPNNILTYKATTQPCIYVLDFDGNGATEGSMDSLPVKYKDLLKLPKNQFQRKLVPCTFVGWHTNRDSMVQQYTDEQTITIADLIKAANVTNTDARLTLYAIWDEAPGFIVTESMDRYFTLDEAKQGIITERELLSTVKAMDKETVPLIQKTKEDVIASGNDIGITTLGYQASDFTTLKNEAVISQLYQVKDEAGNKELLAVNVHVINNTPVVVSTRFRSIEGKYLYKGYEANLKLPMDQRKRAEDLLLQEPEKGGLRVDSFWRTHRSQLDQIYNQEIKDEPPIRVVRVGKETLQKLKTDLKENKVDYININRGSDFKFSKPEGANYEVLEYIRK